jgi:hypothetical protein
MELKDARSQDGQSDRRAGAKMFSFSSIVVEDYLRNFEPPNSG